MDEERLIAWMDERLSEGEDATVRDFIREVLDDRGNLRNENEGARAKISELEAKINDAEMEINRLKSHNYDLLMNGGTDRNEDEEGEGRVENELTDDGEVIHIDDLFIDENDDERKDDE